MLNANGDHFQLLDKFFFQ